MTREASSLLPFPLIDKDVLENGRNSFSLSVNERSVNGLSVNGNGTFACHPDFAGIPEILHRISVRTSLRTGDIVAVELGERLPIHAGEKLCGMLNGENIFSISVL